MNAISTLRSPSLSPAAPPAPAAAAASSAPIASPAAAVTLSASAQTALSAGRAGGIQPSNIIWGSGPSR